LSIVHLLIIDLLVTDDVSMNMKWILGYRIGHHDHMLPPFILWYVVLKHDTN